MSFVGAPLPVEMDARKQQKPIVFPQRLQYLAIFFAAYVLAAGFGHGLGIIPGVSITFWPPAGIFVGTLLTMPHRSWPWWVVTAGVAELTCNALWFENEIHHATVYYIANMLEALTAAWLIRTAVKRPFRLETVEEVSALVLLGACVAPMVGATVIAATDAFLNKHTFLMAWKLVWLGDASGLLISTPLTVITISAWRERASVPLARVLEAAILVLILLVAGWLAIRGYLPTIYMALPPILWTALRFQMQGAAGALGLITLLTAVSTMSGHGEFAGQTALQHENIVMLQAFLSVSAVSALMVAALSVQRQRALVNLQRVNADLEASVAIRTASLRESEERLRLLGDNLPSSVLYQYVHDYKGNSKFLHVSAGIEQLNGVSAEDVLQDAQTFFRQFPPDYLKLLRDAELRSLAELSNIDLEVPMRRTDGELRWMSFHSRPRRLPDGSTIWEGVQVDVTERKMAAMEIQLGAERLRNAAEAAGFVMMHADLTSGRVTYSQELSHLVGTNEGVDYDWNGTLPAWVHPDDHASIMRFYSELGDLADGQSRSIDHRILHRDGSVRWIRLQAKTLFAKDGDRRRATQVIGTLLDITAQRKFEQSLQAALDAAEAASRAKSAFLANMSHEIRTPMTAILGYTDLVAEQMHDGESAQHLRTIKRNGAFLLEIINDILDLSKIEAGKVLVQHQRFAPDRLIEDVRAIMEVRAKENNVALSVEYLSLIPIEIESDPKSLKQILINLVGNAIKFTKQGSVRIVVQHQNRSGESFLQLEIVDTGIGMSEEQLSRMFEPFSQADASVTRKFGGTGLGLAISERLAKALGGHISVASELGKGSTFNLVVSTGNLDGVEMIEPQLVTRTPVPVERQATAQLQGTILIVDDRREIRFLTSRFLLGAGAKVLEAEDGEHAIEVVLECLANATTIDLILLDMQMPRLDGYQTATRLRTLGFHRPIIALTADAMQGDMSRCIESGCNDYLSKPIDKHRLVHLVQHYLELSKVSP